ncbi:tetratricopeptide repeat protein [Actinosynnema sp. NPDC004786]
MTSCRLLNKVGVHLDSQGDTTAAIAYKTRDAYSSERLPGPEDPDTLVSRNNLAYAYQAAGDVARAIPLYEATLTGCERVLGPDHPTTKLVRSNLGRAKSY